MKTKISLLLSAIAVTFLMVQCSDDDGGKNPQQGEVNVKVTDAPSDDANVKGTFVTVSEVRVDGKTVEGFSPQTIEISAYQQGNTKLLVNETLDAGTYNDVALVLDYQQDAEGNSPGCYVLTDDNAKHALAASSESNANITLSKPYEVKSNGMTELVIDFDLRKAVVRNEESGSESEYKFVTETELKNSLRIVKEDESGEIEGNVSNHSSSENNLVVYAYEKGSFNANTETEGQGESKVLFANAETSAKVEQDGSYKLSFLEEGEYEIHMASYAKDSEGNVSFTGMVEASSAVSGLLLNNINVEAKSRVNLDIEIAGLL